MRNSHPVSCMSTVTYLWGIFLIFSLSTTTDASTIKTSKFTISAEIVNGCQASNIKPINFGEVSLTKNTTTLEAQGEVDLICTPGVHATVTIGAGEHSNGLQRFMADVTQKHFIAYQLYHDATHDHPWLPTEHYPIDSLTQTPINIPLYATTNIGDMPTVYPGKYQDMLLVSIQY